jgi:phage major head subunit gpT-like protein
MMKEENMRFHRMAAFALVAVAVSLIYLAASGDALAAPVLGHAIGHPSSLVTFGANLILAVGVDALRAQHTDIVAKATAKIAEIKDGLPAADVARIEGEHAALLADAKTVKTALDTAEAAARTTAPVKAWAAGFYASAALSGLDLAALNTIVAESTTHDQAKDKLIDAMATARNGNKPAATGARVSVGTEATEKFVTGATAALLGRTGLAGGERNEFSGFTMRELARHAVTLRGGHPQFDPMAMVGQAFAPVIMAGALSTSDFTNILANVANKSMLKGFDDAPESFSKWTGTGVLGDFKTAKRVDLGLFPALEQVDEGAEYHYAQLNDRGVNIALATYGKMFPITRQAIINDDLSAFSKVPAKMGAAAKRTVGNLVWAIVTGNPTMADSVALFHATHKNLQSGGGSALAASALDLARAAMAKQVDPDNITQALNIRPAYLLVPVALQGTAHQLMASQSEPGQNNAAVANRVANMAEVIAEARLDVASTTAWYLAGNPSLYDTIEVDYLNGVQTPTLEQREGWNVDGVEFKVRIDAGVNLLDFRALYKSAGA